MNKKLLTMTLFRLNFLNFWKLCTRVLLTGVFLFSATSCSQSDKGTQKSREEGKNENSTSERKDVSAPTEYKPMYWIEGAAEKRSGTLTEAVANTIADDVYSKGWQGITYWGAERKGATMDYFFKSSFLEKQEWASFKKDGLTPLVSAAHKKGLKVMINIEGVNPYHWVENKWTPENIRSVADDLAADGVDAVFEECFEVKPEVFISLARELKSKGVNYISGTDPMLLREANFAALWPETGTIDIYNYYLKRDKIFNIATLAEHGSLGYGWAKYWGKPTSFISPVNRNWGIPGDYSRAVIPYLCMIRALQFRVDNYIIFGGLDTFDPIGIQAWIKEYVDKQEKERPLLNIVVLLKKQTEYSGSETGDPGWNRLFNSGDAITSGAMNAGYNIVVSDKVLPADAYWVYASGGNNDVLPPEVVALFNTDKPVFIQCGSNIPNGKFISPGWKTVLEKCGIDGTKTFGYGERENNSEASLPPNQETDLPYTGYYKDVYLRFTGSDVQRGMDLRSGTVIPKEAISGTIFCAPNKTYGRGPFITGKDKRYVVTATTLNWEVAYPISDLLSGCGIVPSSNVWGIAGKNVTALLAIETTELEITIPGLTNGSNLRVVIWDNKKNKKSEETVVYHAPFKTMLKEYDFILIDKVN
jgi:hypothetical protein